MHNTLIVILGATGVGKTSISTRLAQKLCCPILSADSRQIYKELKIGTAAPTNDELQQAQHYFIGALSIKDKTLYSAGKYEQQALQQLQKIYLQQPIAILTGGSMMYIDAVCNGLDEIPNIEEQIRLKCQQIYKEKGLIYLQEELRKIDPIYYEKIDLNNHKRLIHALEVCYQTNQPYSNLRTGKKKKRTFDIIKIGLDRERSELYEGINQRVDKMIAAGLIQEAEPLYPYKDNNSLNTVGYKEIFAYMDGIYTKTEAIEKIKKNTRNYAKRQLTWFRKDKDITWFHPNDEKKIHQHIYTKIQQKENNL